MTGAPIVFNNYLEESIRSNSFEVFVCSRYGGDLKIESSDHVVLRKTIRTSLLGKLTSKGFDFLRILNLFIKIKPDLIITNTYINALPIITGKILNRKTVCLVHENAGAKIQFLPTRRLIINSVDLIITVSRASSKFCLLQGASLNKIKKISNGLNLSQFVIKSSQATKTTYTLGALANWSKHKRLDVVLRIFERLQGLCDSKFKLIIGGDSFHEYSEEFRNLKEKFESESICFNGIVKNNESFYSHIDGFLFFSEHESFPTVLLETLYYQIPTFTLEGIDSAEEVADIALIQGKDEIDLALRIMSFYCDDYPANYAIWQEKCLTTIKKHDLKIKWNKIEEAIHSVMTTN